MKYFKITFSEEGETDSMAFAAGDEAGAFRQLDELCGPIPRKSCKASEITADEFFEIIGEQ